MTSDEAVESLKCVVGISPSIANSEWLARTLSQRLDATDQRTLGDHAIVVHTSATPAEIRDALAAEGEDVSVFVCEFERWSSYGEAVDRTWLLRRGH